MENRNDQANTNKGEDVPNAGSGAFNQGIEEDPNYDKGTKVSDEEKLSGHSQSPGKEKEKPEEGKIGKKNAEE